MNIFTYIQHLYTAFVLCKCVLTYIFSNYYKINKEGRRHICLESQWSSASTTAARRGCVAIRGPQDALVAKITRWQPRTSLHVHRLGFPMTHSSDPHRPAETASSRRRGLPARAVPPGDGQTPAFMFEHCRLRVDTEGGVVRKAWGPERTQSHPLKNKNSLSQGN